jgi:HrpA-like RNA helicase
MAFKLSASIALPRPQNEVACKNHDTDKTMVASFERACRTHPVAGTRGSAFHGRSRGYLPIDDHRSEILEALSRSQVLLVGGETGSGKSTQVPQYILDAAPHGEHCRVAVSQPRRIAAVELARRVALERGADLSRDRWGSVGYKVRGDARLPSVFDSILYQTEGVLLQTLRSEPYSHYIIDEVHNRTTNIDTILKILRGALRGGAELKVVLMSATADWGSLAAYFAEFSPVEFNVGDVATGLCNSFIRICYFPGYRLVSVLPRRTVYHFAQSKGFVLPICDCRCIILIIFQHKIIF